MLTFDKLKSSKMLRSLFKGLMPKIMNIEPSFEFSLKDTRTTQVTSHRHWYKVELMSTSCKKVNRDDNGRGGAGMG